MLCALLVGAGCARSRFAPLNEGNTEKIVLKALLLEYETELRSGLGSRAGKELTITNRETIGRLLNANLYTEPVTPLPSTGYDIVVVTAVPKDQRERAVSVGVHTGTSPRFFALLNELTTPKSLKWYIAPKPE